MAWRAWEGKGLPGELVREMLIEAVEKRFGAARRDGFDHLLEFLTGNGGAYIAADTRAVARSMGLLPVNTPLYSPQSNGMGTVLAQLAAAFEYFHEVHPHSSFKTRSPREFRRHQAVHVRQEPVQGSALNCE
jgi:putative transposase